MDGCMGVCRILEGMMLVVCNWVEGQLTWKDES
jgi:hypothetical protein